MPTMGGERASKPDAGLPWGFILDPAANAKALGQVQRQGLRAARELVERVVSTIDGTGHVPFSGSGHGERDDLFEGAPVGEYVRAWWELTVQILSTLTGATDVATPAHLRTPLAGDGPITVDVNAGPHPFHWRLKADPKGQFEGSTELWLVNSSASSVENFRLLSGDLRTTEGANIKSSRVTFDPLMEHLPARSSRAVTLALRVDRELAPGVYRGVVQAQSSPHTCITLEIVVERDS